MRRRKTRVGHRNIAVLVVFILFLVAALAFFTIRQPQITGTATGVTYVNITTLVQITMVNNTIEMGILQPGQFNSTLGALNGRPGPFVINNSGNVDVNLTVSATTLWQSIANPSIYFQARCGNASGFSSPEVTPWGGNCTGTFASSLNETAWMNIPSVAPGLPQLFNFSYRKPQLFLHVNVTVPGGEPPANLTSTVTITASIAS